MRLADPPSAIGNEIFENTPLASRQRQNIAPDFGIAAVEEDPHLADDRVILLNLEPAADGPHARKNLADMNRLAHHIIDTCREKTQGLFQRRRLVHRDHGSARTLPNHSRQDLAITAIAKQKSLDCVEIRIRDCLDPFAKFVATETSGRYTFTAEATCVTSGHYIPLIHNHQHGIAPRISCLAPFNC